MSAYRIMMLLPLGVMLAACANNISAGDRSQAQFEASDANIHIAPTKSGSDPYDAVDLGTAYRNANMVNRALPLHHDTSKIYQVFFDTNKSDLDPASRTIIRLAAEDARSAGPVRVTLIGYANATRKITNNKTLSERTAMTVAREMAADGIPNSQIVTSGIGESDPLIPTPDGIREPRNSRVEIIVETTQDPLPNS